MKLGTFFLREVVTAGPWDPIRAVAQLMEREGVGAVVVTRDRRPVGIVTDRDIALALAVHDRPLADPVQSIMTCPVTTMNQSEGVFNATQQMMEHALRRLPVVDGEGGLVGMVTLDDVLMLLARELGNLAQGVRVEVAPPAATEAVAEAEVAAEA